MKEGHLSGPVNNDLVGSEKIQSTFFARLEKLKQWEFLSTRTLGFTFMMMWNFLFFFSGQHLAFANYHKAEVASDIYVISLIANVISVSLLSKAFTHLFKKKRLLIVGAGVVVSAGSVLAAFSSHSEIGGIVCLFLSGALTGVGSALLIVFWGDRYSRSNVTTISVEVPLAFFCASLVVPFSYSVSPIVSLFLLFLLPLTSSVVLSQQSSQTEEVFESSILSEDGSFKNDENIIREQNARPSVAPIKPRKLLLKIIGMSVIFGLCDGLMPNLLSISNISVENSFVYPAATGTALAIFLCFVIFSRHYDFAFAYKPAIILMVLGYLLTILFDRAIVITWFTVTSYTCFNIMNWLLLADICHRYDVSSIQAYGAGRGALHAGGIAVLLIPNALANWVPQGTNQSQLASLVCILLLLVGYLLILTDRDVEALSVHHSVLDKELSVAEKALVIRYRQTVAICDLIASEYDFGDRARDVLICLALGYKSSDIENELYMAQGTVNTHTNRIYRKLNIHKRTELMDLIETYRLKQGI